MAKTTTRLTKGEREQVRRIMKEQRAKLDAYNKKAKRWNRGDDYPLPAPGAYVVLDPETLPPTLYGFFRGGKLESVKVMPDERGPYCAMFNIQSAYLGDVTAAPIALVQDDRPLPIERFAIVHDDGQVADIVKREPGEAYVADFNRIMEANGKPQRARLVPVAIRLLEVEPC